MERSPATRTRWEVGDFWSGTVVGVHPHLNKPQVMSHIPTFSESHAQVLEIISAVLDRELPLGFTMASMTAYQREEAIRRIKEHDPHFHIVGLTRDEARQKVMNTYKQLRTDRVVEIASTLSLEDRVAVAAYIIVAWYAESGKRMTGKGSSGGRKKGVGWCEE